MTTADEYRALSERANHAWVRAIAAQNEAQLITVHILCKVLRDQYPDAAFLVLTPNDEGWEAGEVRDAAGRILTADDQESWDLTGPDHSTNDVSGLVGDLESDMNWEAYAPYNSDPTDHRRYLDVNAVLSTALVGASKTSLRTPDTGGCEPLAIVETVTR